MQNTEYERDREGDALSLDRYRRADLRRLEKPLRLGLGHPDASVGCRISRQIAGMKTNASDNPEEIGHRGANEGRIRWTRIFANIHVLPHDHSAPYVGSVDTGSVIDILLNDLVTSGGSIVSLAPGRDRCGEQHFTTFGEVGVLIREIDQYGNLAGRLPMQIIRKILKLGTTTQERQDRQQTKPQQLIHLIYFYAMAGVIRVK